jgi:transcriptional regulator NrdR family protein
VYFIFNIQAACAYLHGEFWNIKGVTRGLVDEENVECKTNHLSSFVMAVLDVSEVHYSVRYNCVFRTMRTRNYPQTAN